MQLSRLIPSMLRLSLASITLLCAAGAQAQETYKVFDNGWTIRQYSNRCTAVGEYTGDKMLFITYSPTGSNVRLTIYHPYATSLNDGEEVELYVKFIIADTIDNGWGQTTFKVGAASDGGRFINGDFEAYDMLRDIARATRLGFTLDPTSDRIVAVYDLTGSAVMIKALRECALKAVNLNPKDPFVD